jgi:hypothetical protein
MNIDSPIPPALEDPLVRPDPLLVTEYDSLEGLSALTGCPPASKALLKLSLCADSHVLFLPVSDNPAKGLSIPAAEFSQLPEAKSGPIDADEAAAVARVMGSTARSRSSGSLMDLGWLTSELCREIERSAAPTPAAPSSPLRALQSSFHAVLDPAPVRAEDLASTIAHSVRLCPNASFLPHALEVCEALRSFPDSRSTRAGIRVLVSFALAGNSLVLWIALLDALPDTVIRLPARQAKELSDAISAWQLLSSNSELVFLDSAGPIDLAAASLSAQVLGPSQALAVMSALRKAAFGESRIPSGYELVAHSVGVAHGGPVAVVRALVEGGSPQLASLGEGLASLVGELPPPICGVDRTVVIGMPSAWFVASQDTKLLLPPDTVPVFHSAAKLPNKSTWSACLCKLSRPISLDTACVLPSPTHKLVGFINASPSPSRCSVDLFAADAIESSSAVSPFWSVDLDSVEWLFQEESCLAQLLSSSALLVVGHSGSWGVWNLVSGASVCCVLTLGDRHAASSVRLCPIMHLGSLGPVALAAKHPDISSLVPSEFRRLTLCRDAVSHPVEGLGSQVQELLLLAGAAAASIELRHDLDHSLSFSHQLACSPVGVQILCRLLHARGERSRLAAETLLSVALSTLGRWQQRELSSPSTILLGDRYVSDAVSLGSHARLALLTQACTPGSPLLAKAVPLVLRPPALARLLIQMWLGAPLDLSLISDSFVGDFSPSEVQLCLERMLPFASPTWFPSYLAFSSATGVLDASTACLDEDLFVALVDKSMRRELSSQDHAMLSGLWGLATDASRASSPLLMGRTSPLETGVAAFLHQTLRILDDGSSAFARTQALQHLQIVLPAMSTLDRMQQTQLAPVSLRLIFALDRLLSSGIASHATIVRDSLVRQIRSLGLAEAPVEGHPMFDSLLPASASVDSVRTSLERYKATQAWARGSCVWPGAKRVKLKTVQGRVTEALVAMYGLHRVGKLAWMEALVPSASALPPDTPPVVLEILDAACGIAKTVDSAVDLSRPWSQLLVALQCDGEVLSRDRIVRELEHVRALFQACGPSSESPEDCAIAQTREVEEGVFSTRRMWQALIKASLCLIVHHPGKEFVLELVSLCTSLIGQLGWLQRDISSLSSLVEAVTQRVAKEVLEEHCHRNESKEPDHDATTAAAVTPRAVHPLMAARFGSPDAVDPRYAGLFGTARDLERFGEMTPAEEDLQAFWQCAAPPLHLVAPLGVHQTAVALGQLFHCLESGLASILAAAEQPDNVYAPVVSSVVLTPHRMIRECDMDPFSPPSQRALALAATVHAWVSHLSAGDTLVSRFMARLSEPFEPIPWDKRHLLFKAIARAIGISTSGDGSIAPASGLRLGSLRLAQPSRGAATPFTALELASALVDCITEDPVIRPSGVLGACTDLARELHSWPDNVELSSSVFQGVAHDSPLRLSFHRDKVVAAVCTKANLLAQQLLSASLSWAKADVLEMLSSSFRHGLGLDQDCSELNGSDDLPLCAPLRTAALINQRISLAPARALRGANSCFSMWFCIQGQPTADVPLLHLSPPQPGPRGFAQLILTQSLTLQWVTQGTAARPPPKVLGVPLAVAPAQWLRLYAVLEWGSSGFLIRARVSDSSSTLFDLPSLTWSEQELCLSRPQCSTPAPVLVMSSSCSVRVAELAPVSPPKAFTLPSPQALRGSLEQLRNATLSDEEHSCALLTRDMASFLWCVATRLPGLVKDDWARHPAAAAQNVATQLLAWSIISGRLSQARKSADALTLLDALAPGGSDPQRALVSVALACCSSALEAWSGAVDMRSVRAVGHESARAKWAAASCSIRLAQNELEKSADASAVLDWIGEDLPSDAKHARLFLPRLAPVLLLLGADLPVAAAGQRVQLKLQGLEREVVTAISSVTEASSRQLVLLHTFDSYQHAQEWTSSNSLVPILNPCVQDAQTAPHSWVLVGFASDDDVLGFSSRSVGAILPQVAVELLPPSITDGMRLPIYRFLLRTAFPLALQARPSGLSDVNATVSLGALASLVARLVTPSCCKDDPEMEVLDAFQTLTGHFLPLIRARPGVEKLLKEGRDSAIWTSKAPERTPCPDATLSTVRMALSSSLLGLPLLWCMALEVPRRSILSEQEDHALNVFDSLESGFVDRGHVAPSELGVSPEAHVAAVLLDRPHPTPTGPAPCPTSLSKRVRADLNSTTMQARIAMVPASNPRQLDSDTLMNCWWDPELPGANTDPEDDIRRPDSPSDDALSSSHERRGVSSLSSVFSQSLVPESMLRLQRTSPPGPLEGIPPVEALMVPSLPRAAREPQLTRIHRPVRAQRSMRLSVRAPESRDMPALDISRPITAMLDPRPLSDGGRAGEVGIVLGPGPRERPRSPASDRAESPPPRTRARDGLANLSRSPSPDRSVPATELTARWTNVALPRHGPSAAVESLSRTRIRTTAQVGDVTTASPRAEVVRLGDPGPSDLPASDRQRRLSLLHERRMALTAARELRRQRLEETPAPSWAYEAARRSLARPSSPPGAPLDHSSTQSRLREFRSPRTEAHRTRVSDPGSAITVVESLPTSAAFQMQWSQAGYLDLLMFTNALLVDWAGEWASRAAERCMDVTPTSVSFTLVREYALGELSSRRGLEAKARIRKALSVSKFPEAAGFVSDVLSGLEGSSSCLPSLARFLTFSPLLHSPILTTFCQACGQVDLSGDVHRHRCPSCSQGGLRVCKLVSSPLQVQHLRRLASSNKLHGCLVSLCDEFPATSEVELDSGESKEDEHGEHESKEAAPRAIPLAMLAFRVRPPEWRMEGVDTPLAVSFPMHFNPAPLDEAAASIPLSPPMGRAEAARGLFLAMRRATSNLPPEANLFAASDDVRGHVLPAGAGPLPVVFSLRRVGGILGGYDACELATDLGADWISSALRGMPKGSLCVLEGQIEASDGRRFVLDTRLAVAEAARSPAESSPLSVIPSVSEGTSTTPSDSMELPQPHRVAARIPLRERPTPSSPLVPALTASPELEPLGLRPVTIPPARALEPEPPQSPRAQGLANRSLMVLGALWLALAVAVGEWLFWGVTTATTDVSAVDLDAPVGRGVWISHTAVFALCFLVCVLQFLLVWMPTQDTTGFKVLSSVAHSVNLIAMAQIASFAGLSHGMGKQFFVSPHAPCGFPERSPSWLVSLPIAAPRSLWSALAGDEASLACEGTGVSRWGQVVVVTLGVVLLSAAALVHRDVVNVPASSPARADVFLRSFVSVMEHFGVFSLAYWMLHKNHSCMLTSGCLPAITFGGSISAEMTARSAPALVMTFHDFLSLSSSAAPLVLMLPLQMGAIWWFPSFVNWRTVGFVSVILSVATNAVGAVMLVSWAWRWYGMGRLGRHFSREDYTALTDFLLLCLGFLGRVIVAAFVGAFHSNQEHEEEEDYLVPVSEPVREDTRPTETQLAPTSSLDSPAASPSVPGSGTPVLQAVPSSQVSMLDPVSSASDGDAGSPFVDSDDSRRPLTRSVAGFDVDAPQQPPLPRYQVPGFEDLELALSIISECGLPPSPLLERLVHVLLGRAPDSGRADLSVRFCLAALAVVATQCESLGAERSLAHCVCALRGYVGLERPGASWSSLVEVRRWAPSTQESLLGKLTTATLMKLETALSRLLLQRPSLVTPAVWNAYCGSPSRLVPSVFADLGKSWGHRSMQKLPDVGKSDLVVPALLPSDARMAGFSCLPAWAVRLLAEFITDRRPSRDRSRRVRGMPSERDICEGGAPLSALQPWVLSEEQVEAGCDAGALSQLELSVCPDFAKGESVTLEGASVVAVAASIAAQSGCLDSLFPYAAGLLQNDEAALSTRSLRPTSSFVIGHRRGSIVDSVVESGEDATVEVAGSESELGNLPAHQVRGLGSSSHWESIRDTAAPVLSAITSRKERATLWHRRAVVIARYASLIRFLVSHMEHWWDLALVQPLENPSRLHSDGECSISGQLAKHTHAIAGVWSVMPPNHRLTAGMAQAKSTPSDDRKEPALWGRRARSTVRFSRELVATARSATETSTLAAAARAMQDCTISGGSVQAVQHRLGDLAGALVSHRQLVQRSLAGCALGQLMRELGGQAREVLRASDGDSMFRASLTGERAMDLGGPYRAVFETVGMDLNAGGGRLCLPCLNGQRGVGRNDDFMVPNPLACGEALRYWEFLGALMGGVLLSRGKVVLPVDLAPLVWKRLVGERVSWRDVVDVHTGVEPLFRASMHAQCAAVDSPLTLTRMLSGESEHTEPVGIHTFHFTVTRADGSLHELVPGGSAVSAASSEQVATLADRTLEWHSCEFDLQVHAMRNGLATVIPIGILPLMGWRAFSESIAGVPDVPVDVLRRHTKVTDGEEDTAVMGMLWEVLEGWDHRMRCRFLNFVWGRSRLPREEDMRQDMTVRIVGEFDPSTGSLRLPSAATCSFTLKLPAYSSVQLLRERLELAVTYCDTIDGD